MSLKQASLCGSKSMSAILSVDPGLSPALRSPSPSSTDWTLTAAAMMATAAGWAWAITIGLSVGLAVGLEVFAQNTLVLHRERRRDCHPPRSARRRRLVLTWRPPAGR
jgi:hypothetical protein